MDAILSLSTLLALVGAYLVSQGMWQGFAIWTVTNTVFAIHNFLIEEWQMFFLFVAYFFLAVNGLYNFTKRAKTIETSN